MYAGTSHATDEARAPGVSRAQRALVYPIADIPYPKLAQR